MAINSKLVQALASQGISLSGVDSLEPSYPTLAAANAEMAGQSGLVTLADGSVLSYVDGVVVAAPGESLRQVATNCGINGGSHTGAQAVMSRSRHYLRSSTGAFSLLYTSWLHSVSLGDIANGFGNSLIKASIETSAGVIIPVTFAGVGVGDLIDGSEIVSDEIYIAGIINVGDYFYVRTFATGVNGLYQAGHKGSLDHGEGSLWSYNSASIATVPDQTGVSGAIVKSGASNLFGADYQTGDNGIEWMYRPTAIIGRSNEPAFGLFGDSRVHGAADFGINTKFNDFGIFARPIGATTAYINCGTPSATAVNDSVSGHISKISSLINRFCTGMVCNLGINDIGYGGAAQTLMNNLNIIYSKFSIPVHQSTINPSSVITGGGTVQTAHPTNAVRVAFNNAIRRGGFDFTGGNKGSFSVIDTAAVLESPSVSGTWADINYCYPLVDGIHESQLACLTLQSSAVFANIKN